MISSSTMSLAFNQHRLRTSAEKIRRLMSLIKRKSNSNTVTVAGQPIQICFSYRLIRRRLIVDLTLSKAAADVSLHTTAPIWNSQTRTNIGLLLELYGLMSL